MCEAFSNCVRTIVKCDSKLDCITNCLLHYGYRRKDTKGLLKMKYSWIV